MSTRAAVPAKKTSLADELGVIGLSMIVLMVLSIIPLLLLEWLHIEMYAEIIKDVYP